MVKNEAIIYLMKIKVCGMKSPENMQAISELPVDILGMIFYGKSPRCIDDRDTDRINALALTIPKVGVFVDAAFETVLDKLESGLSNPETVIQLRHAGFQGFLMGEIFMKTADPGAMLKEFIGKIYMSF